MKDDNPIPPARPLPNPISRAEQAFSLAGSWLFSDAMEKLLAAFGERIASREELRFSGAGDPAVRLHLNEELPGWLSSVLIGSTTTTKSKLSSIHLSILSKVLAMESAAARHFNFRTDPMGLYRERSQAIKADFNTEFRRNVLALASQLGLVRVSHPRHRTYDHTLILGGGYKSPLLRARYAAEFQARGVGLGEISFLGSPRFLTTDPPELPSVDGYAPGATDEFELMIGAARAEFGFTPGRTDFLCGCSSADLLCPAWRRRQAGQVDETPGPFTHERETILVDDVGSPQARVLSASTGRPPHRPQTADTFDLWARRSTPQAKDRVLVVTTRVFVPFQTFDGLRRLYLPHGVDLDVVGFGAEWGDRPQTAEYLLQETLSGIRSARRLLVGAADLLRTRSE